LDIFLIYFSPKKGKSLVEKGDFQQNIYPFDSKVSKMPLTNSVFYGEFSWKFHKIEVKKAPMRRLFLSSNIAVVCCERYFLTSLSFDTLFIYQGL